MTDTIHLIPDTDCANPITGDSAVGTLLTVRAYDFGHDNGLQVLRNSLEDAMTDLLRWRRPGLDHGYTAADEQLPCPRCRSTPRPTCIKCKGTGWTDNPYWVGQSPDTLLRIHDEHEHRIKPGHRLHWTPVYLYEHSQSALSTTPFSCGWDSGLVGYLFITGLEIKELMGVKNIYQHHIEQATAMMTGLLPALEQWINGDCWGFELRRDGEVVDSCWGFYGSDIEQNGMAQYLPANWKQLEVIVETP